VFTKIKAKRGSGYSNTPN